MSCGAQKKSGRRICGKVPRYRNNLRKKKAGLFENNLGWGGGGGGGAIKKHLNEEAEQRALDKFSMPYVQKTLLSDTLKLNYLANPALTVVKDLTDIDEIWKRLIRSYGNTRVLLQNKLGALSKLSDLDKVRGDEKLASGLSELLNVLAEVSRLAGKYGLENELYYGGGLGKVTDLMGFARNRRFLEKNVPLNLSNKEKVGKNYSSFGVRVRMCSGICGGCKI